MQPISQRKASKRVIALLLIGTFFLVGCSCSILSGVNDTLRQVLNLPTPTPVDPGSVLEKFSDIEIKKGIQSTLDDYEWAFNNNDLELFKKITDPENLPFRRLVLSRFNTLQESVNGGSFSVRLEVESVVRLSLGFVQAHIIVNNDYATDWIFRLEGKKWLLSEPTKEQFGEPYEKETEHFTYELYHWIDKDNITIITLMENAAKRVENKLGTLPEEKAKVIILPGYSADPYANANALAYYSSGGGDELDSITIFAPSSYSFGWYSVESGWETDLEDTLTHEYTHMTHMRVFDKAGRMMDWFSEGLAEYVSDSPRYLEIQYALDPDQLIPIIDNTTNYYQQDLRHIYLLRKDVSLAYAEAESLIMFIHDNYGGMGTVWALARADDELQDFDEALQATLGIDYETFEKEWRAWLTDTLFGN
jgi:hypothetical protein